MPTTWRGVRYLKTGALRSPSHDSVHVQTTDGKATAKMRFTVPYVRWGMKNPGTLLLRVSDKVEIDIVARAR